MTHGTCRLTAKNRDRLRNPTLGNRVWATFDFFYLLFRGSRSAGPRLWVVSVDLSGYCPGQYPSMQPPLSWRAGLELSYLRTRVRQDTTGDQTFAPPTDTCPSPENSYRGHYSLVCVRVGTAGRCPRWWFLGEVSEEGANAQHALRINRHLQF